jgi:glutamate-1-semialdehyde aminotransferase
MSECELHIHMARTYLHQAMVVRMQGHHHGWHATLLLWAANRRLLAMQTVEKTQEPAQLDLFA